MPAQFMIRIYMMSLSGVNSLGLICYRDVESSCEVIIIYQLINMVNDDHLNYVGWYQKHDIGLQEKMCKYNSRWIGMP